MDMNSKFFSMVQTKSHPTKAPRGCTFLAFDHTKRYLAKNIHTDLDKLEDYVEDLSMESEDNPLEKINKMKEITNKTSNYHQGSFTTAMVMKRILKKLPKRTYGNTVTKFRDDGVFNEETLRKLKQKVKKIKECRISLGRRNRRRYKKNKKIKNTNKNDDSSSSNHSNNCKYNEFIGLLVNKLGSLTTALNSHTGRNFNHPGPFN